MSVAPAECYLTQYMACFKQLGHFELLRDRMLYHFSETAQQQRATGEMSEDDFQGERAAVQTCCSSDDLVELTAGWVCYTRRHNVAYLSLGRSADLSPLGWDALLEAGGARCAAGLQGGGDGLGDGSRLYVGAGRWDDVLPLMRPYGPLGVPAVGGLVAGLTWDFCGLRPRTGVLSWRVSPRTLGRSRPRPRPVLVPGGRQMHQ